MRFTKSTRPATVCGILASILAIALAACSSDPNHQKVKYLNSGERYLKRGEYSAAVIEFRNAVDLDPRFEKGHAKLAEGYLRLGNSEAAYREFLEAVTLDPGDRDAELQLARLSIARRQFDQAQTAAQTVLHSDPGSADAHAILGEKQLLTGHLPDAMREFQQAVDLAPRQVEHYIALAAAYVSAGQTAEAEAVDRKAIENNPGSVDARINMGQFCFTQGRLPEAEAEMRQAVALEPKAVLPRVLWARILVREGKLADAEKLYQGIKTIAPNDPKAYQALGLFYLASGQKEKAAAEFRAMMASKPKDTSVKLNLVETLIDLNRIQEAADVEQQVIRDDPSSPRALLAKGRILIAQGRPQDAIPPLEQAVQTDVQSARGYYFLGIAQKALRMSDLARASFNRALALSPGMPEAEAQLASLNAAAGQNDEALDLAASALKERPGMPLAQIASAKALLAKGQTQQAEAALQQLLSRDPTSLPALAQLLNVCRVEKKTAEAVTRIAGLVEQNPRNADLHFLLALGYFDLKDLDKSESALKQALALDPATPEAYSLLANIDLARGAVDAAKQDFRKAINLRPRNLSNYLALAAEFEREKNWSEAEKLYEKAHQVDPDSVPAAGSLALLYLDHGGDANVAFSLAQAVRQKMPDSPLTADTLGWAYYKMGSYDSAVALLRESIKGAPHNAMFEYHLGLAYLADHQNDAARRTLQQSIQDDPRSPFVAEIKKTLQKLAAGSN